MGTLGFHSFSNCLTLQKCCPDSLCVNILEAAQLVLRSVLVRKLKPPFCHLLYVVLLQGNRT